MQVRSCFLNIPHWLVCVCFVNSNSKELSFSIRTRLPILKRWCISYRILIKLSQPFDWSSEHHMKGSVHPYRCWASAGGTKTWHLSSDRRVKATKKVPCSPIEVNGHCARMGREIAPVNITEHLNICSWLLCHYLAALLQLFADISQSIKGLHFGQVLPQVLVDLQPAHKPQGCMGLYTHAN